MVPPDPPPGFQISRLRQQVVERSSIHGIDRLFEQLTLSPIFESEFKFAYDIFDIIAEKSNGELKLNSVHRPNFSPQCRTRMTLELKGLFEHQWSTSQQLKLIYLILNFPALDHREQFINYLWAVYRKYRSSEFSKQHSVEFLFLVAFWSLVLQARNEYRGATDFAIELITVFTRDVVEENGGFDVCTVWPSLKKVMGTDPALRPLNEDEEGE